MKKLMLAAAALTAGFAMAEGDGITSANVVGYSSQDIAQSAKEQWINVALQFENIDKAGFARIDQVLKMAGVPAVGYDGMESNAAEIQFWNGSGYDHYYYINEAYDVKTDTPITGDYWVDFSGYTLTDSALHPIGDGLWLKIPANLAESGANFTVAGAVNTASELGVDLTGSAAGTWNLASNPFPTATDLASVTTTGLTAVGYDGMETLANEIMFWNGSGYDHYYYINEAYDWKTDTPVTGDFWVDFSGYTLGKPVASVGASFWGKIFQDGTLTFKK